MSNPYETPNAPTEHSPRRSALVPVFIVVLILGGLMMFGALSFQSTATIGTPVAVPTVTNDVTDVEQDQEDNSSVEQEEPVE